MFTQRLLTPALQVVGRSFACSSSDLFQNVRNFNPKTPEYQLNTSSDGTYSNNLYGHFSSQFQKIGNGSFVKVVSRNFGAATYHFTRKFSSTSNENMHNILCSLPEYRNTTFNFENVLEPSNFQCPQLNLLDKNQDNSLQQLITKFQNMSYILSNPNAVIEKENISFILKSLMINQHSFTFSQLVDILMSAKQWQSAMLDNFEFEQFMNEIEKYCSRKLKKWSLSQCLLIADFWFILNGSKNSLYIKTMFITYKEYLSCFSLNQFVQFMFYISAIDEYNSLYFPSLKEKLKRTIPNLSINEVGIVSMGLVKFSMELNVTPIPRRILERLINEKENVSDEMIVSILKFLKLSYIKDKLCLSLFDEFLYKIDKHNIFVQSQFCQFASSQSIYHKEFMNKLLTSFITNIESIRLKDIERFAFALMIFKIGQSADQNVYKLIVEELRKSQRIIEINHFPHIFVSCMAHLAKAGVYPLDLISAVFQPSMLQYLKDQQNSCSYTNIFRSVIEISWALLIEGPPNYLGYQLDCNYRNELTQKYLTRIPSADMKNLSDTEKKLIYINKSLSAFLHPVSSSIVHILPHLNSLDIVFCTNAEGKPVQIPESYFRPCNSNIRKPVNNEDDIRWNAVILLRKNLYFMPNNELKGSTIHKIRLLEKLGYYVSLAMNIPENMSEAKKFQYFKDILSSSTLDTTEKSFIGDKKISENYSYKTSVQN